FIITRRLLFVNNFFEVFFDRIKLRKLSFFNDLVILSCVFRNVKNFSAIFLESFITLFLKSTLINLSRKPRYVNKHFHLIFQKNIQAKDHHSLLLQKKHKKVCIIEYNP
ncbi:hypothetical protein EAI86_13095, partial [Enterococcus hirae]